MSLLDRFRRTPTEPVAKRSGIDWLGQSSFMFGGHTYPGGMQTTWTGEKAEPIGNSFEAYAAAMSSNGPLFALAETRRSVLSEIRFQWQALQGGKPGKLYGTQDLSILERPWVNATTGDLVSRMEQYDTLAGNAYVIRRGGRLKVLRPDWVSIVLTTVNGDPHALDATPLAYLYWPGGRYSGSDPVTILPPDIAHYAPTPDPLALYRGMSWMTPIIREIQADNELTKFTLKFFENAATPNLAVALDKSLTQEQFTGFMDAMDASHAGVDTAWKTLYLAGGADVTVIGSNIKDLELADIQGAGMLRMAAAANVPPIVAGFATDASYANYGAARRTFSDKFLRGHWRAMAGALETIVPAPTGSRLWYDTGDVSFLQEDEKDAADIAQQQATTIRTLTDAGFTPESVTEAVMAGDLSRIIHSGLYSVQLQAAGSDPALKVAP